MVSRARQTLVWSAAALLSCLSGSAGLTEPGQVDNIRDVVAKMKACWRPPPPSSASPIDITVIVSFNRAGEIFGHPRITYESEAATDNDRLIYRIAVMETLQRCTPMPFTEGMAGAVAGRPFAFKFHVRKPPPQPEKRAWLTPKIL
jgi:hypothetical protein